MEILAILVTIFGIIGGVATLPQAIKIFKNKHARDVSITTYMVMITATFFWLLYGISINNFPLIIANSFGLFSVVLVIIGWVVYH